MRELIVSMELNGKQQPVGKITGNSTMDAYFTYDQEYLDLPEIKPISISLPLQKEPHSVDASRMFFEGLLPEGFSRRAVAGWMRADESDYLTIVEGLGQECLGSIMISIDNEDLQSANYKKLTNDEIKALAAEGASTSTQLLMETHLSLTGATGKVGLYFDEDSKDWYLPLGNAASTHIVKQSHIRFDQIVLNEQLCMETAKNIGIDVSESFILNLGNGKDDDVLYATKRYDRTLSDELIDGLRRPYRLHQEDFAQALGIPAIDKYEAEKSGYLGKMFDLIRHNSTNPIEDQVKLWDRIIFNYLVGNADCHLKNYSLLYDSDMRSVRLSPAYDILCTRAYKASNEFSIYVGNEVRMDEISRESFETAAKEAGLGHKLAMQHFDNLAQHFDDALDKAIEAVEARGFNQAEEFGMRIRNNKNALHLSQS